MVAADATGSPVTQQANRGARAKTNDVVPAKLIDALVEIYPHIPVCMHLDHGNTLATCATAVQHGFTSVMMDGSLMADGCTPASYAYNVEITRQVVRMAYAAGVLVEGELGGLMIAMGTSHGAWKRSRRPERRTTLIASCFLSPPMMRSARPSPKETTSVHEVSVISSTRPSASKK